MIYKLTKTSIKEGHTSGVRSGYSVEGDSLASRNSDTGVFKDDVDISEIEVGDMVALVGDSFLKTSPISKIISLSTVELLFETGSSTYTLEILDEK